MCNGGLNSFQAFDPPISPWASFGFPGKECARASSPLREVKLAQPNSLSKVRAKVIICGSNAKLTHLMIGYVCLV